MIRALTIVTAVAALAVSESPASAGILKARTPKPSGVVITNGAADDQWCVGP
jgi:hypothetical protein